MKHPIRTKVGRWLNSLHDKKLEEYLDSDIEEPLSVWAFNIPQNIYATMHNYARNIASYKVYILEDSQVYSYYWIKTLYFKIIEYKIKTWIGLDFWV